MSGAHPAGCRRLSSTVWALFLVLWPWLEETLACALQGLGKGNVCSPYGMQDSTSLWWKGDVELKNNFLCCSNVAVNIQRPRMLVFNHCTIPVNKTPDSCQEVEVKCLGHHPFPPSGTGYGWPPSPHNFTCRVYHWFDSSPPSKPVSRIGSEIDG